MKDTSPSTSKTAFACPHCGAYTTQTWFETYADPFSGESRKPTIYRGDLVEYIQNDTEMPAEAKVGLVKWAAKVVSGEPFVSSLGNNSKYVHHELPTVHMSVCYECDHAAIWLGEKLVHPAYNFTLQPNADLNDDIKHDFREAGAILKNSPRGAAALLRLALQKLCKQLGKPGKNLDDDIGALVAGGLDVKIQKSLDLVRVIGNNAVHPGQIDIRDDPGTATKLFNLINLIADRLITHPKEIESLYNEKVPENAKKGIEKRDSSTAP